MTPEVYQEDKCPHGFPSIHAKITCSDCRVSATGESLGAPEEVAQPILVEDLKNQRLTLEVRVANIHRQREEDVAKKLKNREIVIAEDARLVPLLDEARSTLEYFEAQMEQGVLTAQTDIAELENLRNLVASLEQQRAQALQQYEAIMHNPEIYEKVWEEAHGEKMSRELKEKSDAAKKEIQEKVEVLAQAIENLSSRRDFAWDQMQSKKEAMEAQRAALRKIIEDARRGLNLRAYEDNADVVAWDLGHESFGLFVDGLEKHRKTYGFYGLIGGGKQKAAVDYVLNERDKFTEADRRVEEYKQSNAEVLALDAEVDKLAEQYKILLLDAWTRENALRPDAKKYAGSDLPELAHYSIEKSLQKKAGLGSMKNGEWVPPHSLDLSEGGLKRNEFERFGKLYSVFQRIENKAGRYLWLQNPENEQQG